MNRGAPREPLQPESANEAFLHVSIGTAVVAVAEALRSHSRPERIESGLQGYLEAGVAVCD
jgi:hypothetical protein